MSSREFGAEPLSRTRIVCERVVEAGWLAALAAVPLYFDVFSSRVFEPDKTTYLRCLVLLMLLAQSVALSETVPSASSSSIVSRIRGWAIQNPLILPVLAFAAVQILATVTSIAPSISLFGSYQRLQGTYTFFTYAALFFLIVANLRRADQLRRIWLVALGTSLPICLYGLLQHLQLDPLPWGGDVVFRVTSTMGNAIFLSAYLIMVIPLTAARLVSALARLQLKDLPATGAGGRIVRQWAIVIVLQNALLASLLLVGEKWQGIWWAAPGMIGIFTLLLTQLPAAPIDRYVTQVEAVALGALLCLQVVVVFLTQSRGPWLGLLAGAVVFVLLLESRARAARRLLMSTSALIVVAAAVLVVFNLPASPLARFRDVPYLGRLGQLSDVNDGTGRVRVLIWQGTFDLLRQQPNIGIEPDPLRPIRLIVGYGPEAMHLAYNAVYPPALGDLESRNASPDRNHNDLLDHLVMTGVLGLAAYLVLLVVALRLAWRDFRQSRSLGEAALLGGLASAIIAHVVESQTGIAIVSTQTYLWVALAVLVVVAQRPDVLRDIPRRSPEVLPPIAGGAPSTTRPKRSQRPVSRPPQRAVPSAGPGASDARAALRAPTPAGGWGIIAAYGMLVVAVSAGAVALADSGLFGAQVMAYLAFTLLAGSLPIFAARGDWPGAFVPTRSRTFWIGVAGGTVAAVAIGLNLNGLAADVYQKQGTSLDSQQRYAESTQSFASALALVPTQDYYALFLGRGYLELASAAASQPPSAASGGPSQPTLESLLARPASDAAKLSQADALASAEVALKRARDLNPLDPDHYANLSRMYRLWGQTTDKSKVALAAQYAMLAATLSPHSAQIYDEWAATLMVQGDLPGALAKAQYAADLDPQYAAPRVILGDVRLAQNQIDGALVDHLAALDLDPTALSDSGFEHRVSAYVATGKAQALADKYAQILEQQPSRTVRVSYAFLLTELNQPSAAVEQFRVVVDEDPSDWVAARNLAVAYARTGDKASAKTAATHALQVAPPEQRGSIQALIDSLGS